jgi:hypothetical protein
MSETLKRLTDEDLAEVIEALSALRFRGREEATSFAVLKGEAKRARDGEAAERAKVERLAKAAKSAADWMWDPDDAEQFERIAEEFYRETGLLRPGKDAAAATASDHGDRWVGWNRWRTARQLKVLADLRAALRECGLEVEG